MEKFCKTIKKIESNIMKILKTNKQIIMTKEDDIDFGNSTHCYLCGCEIKENDPKGCKVRDHCHITGKYRGCAHDVCNINYNYKNIKIPVFSITLKKL